MSISILPPVSSSISTLQSGCIENKGRKLDLTFNLNETGNFKLTVSIFVF